VIGSPAGSIPVFQEALDVHRRSLHLFFAMPQHPSFFSLLASSPLPVTATVVASAPLAFTPEAAPSTAFSLYGPRVETMIAILA
jgi:hypothetical protein